MHTNPAYLDSNAAAPEHATTIQSIEPATATSTAMASKTALLLGASGATGGAILDCLLAHPAYASVVAFARRPIHRSHPKLVTHLVDFDHVESWQDKVQGDELFSALGTTLNLAGSRDGQYTVDFTYQLHVAEAARENGVPAIFLVSAPGADGDSANFYLRTKGELDHAVLELCFPRCTVIKPSLIEAERPDSRRAEKLAGICLRYAAAVLPPLRRIRPITAAELGQAIVSIAQHELPDGLNQFTLDELFQYIPREANNRLETGGANRRQAIARLKR